jgi:hypothetical protein
MVVLPLIFASLQVAERGNADQQRGKNKREHNHLYETDESRPYRTDDCCIRTEDHTSDSSEDQSNEDLCRDARSAKGCKKQDNYGIKHGQDLDDFIPGYICRVTQMISSSTESNCKNSPYDSLYEFSSHPGGLFPDNAMVPVMNKVNISKY